MTPKCVLWQREKTDENNEMAQKCGISSGYTLFVIKEIKDLQRKKYFIWNDNLWPFDVYNGPSQVYCFKPEGKIHKCIKG